MTRITRYLSLSLLMLLTGGSLFGQVAPPATLVTIPTAGTLLRGQYDLEVLMQAGGGILGRVGIGLSDRFTMGMSYGVQQFIGDEKPTVNKAVPEAQLKYRFYDESYQMPALALGLDTQGKGIFYEENEVFGGDTLAVGRYEIKAIGVYLVASKNWSFMGNLGTHLGICKNFLEEDEEDKDINFFMGVDKDFGSGISGFLEYNAALDDNDYNYDEISFGQGRGYLNAGIRLIVANNLFLEIDVNDIVKNKGEVEYFSRELKVVYSEFF